MSLRRIVCFPEPALRQSTQAVAQIDETIKKLVADMCDTMYAAEGAGLAAIQLGATVRIFIIDNAVAGRPKEDPPVVFINPEILSLSKETETKDEGCLSFPGVFIPVKRSLVARVRAQDLNGEWFEVEADDSPDKGGGLYARALQHEYDHLENRLLVDHVGPVKRQMIKRKLERIRG